MELADALAALEAAGTEQNRRIYLRRGAGENQYGVSFNDLRVLAKRIGRDHDLALGVWRTGNADARLLACMVADPSRMSEDDLDGWIGDISYHVLVDEFVGDVASRVPGVRSRMERWIHSPGDWTAQAGWDLVGHLAQQDPDLPDEYFLDLLAAVERDIRRSGNRTRHAMNGALIAIGVRNESLRAAAVAAAERIGRVIVDHGQTGCVTPAAIPYIERTIAHREAQAARRAAKEAASRTTAASR